MTDLNLSEKTVIITGGAGGLGLAFASGFAKAGANVLIADIDADAVRAATDGLDRMAGRVVGGTVDVADEVSVKEMFDLAVETFGRIDVLINNAAIYAALKRKPFFEIPVDEWDRVMRVNLRGAFLCAKAAHAHMRGRGGKIINIASATVMSGSPMWLHYVTSKGGLIAMTRVLARELGDEGITVNAVAPGFTLTDAARGTVDEPESYGVDRGAIRRASVPEDIVGAVLWLASPLSDFVTGQTIVVDGGRQFL